MRLCPAALPFTWDARENIDRFRGRLCIVESWGITASTSVIALSLSRCLLSLMGHEIEVMALLRFSASFSNSCWPSRPPNVAAVLPPDLVVVLNSSRQPPWDQFCSAVRSLRQFRPTHRTGYCRRRKYRSGLAVPFHAVHMKHLGAGCPSRGFESYFRYFLKVHCSRKILRDASASVVDLTVGPSRLCLRYGGNKALLKYRKFFFHFNAQRVLQQAMISIFMDWWPHIFIIVHTIGVYNLPLGSSRK